MSFSPVLVVRQQQGFGDEEYGSVCGGVIVEESREKKCTKRIEEEDKAQTNPQADLEATPKGLWCYVVMMYLS